VTSRRFVQILLVVILVLSPFGRIGAAHGTLVAGHCAGAPAPHHGKAQQDGVDCMIACAAIAPTPAALDCAPPVLARAAHPARPDSFHAGLHLGADPPPPRLA
jgi:hypothetical protein